MPGKRQKGKKLIGAWLTVEEWRVFEELSKIMGTWDKTKNKPNMTETIREAIKRLSDQYGIK